MFRYAIVFGSIVFNDLPVANKDSSKASPEDQNEVRTCCFLFYAWTELFLKSF